MYFGLQSMFYKYVRGLNDWNHHKTETGQKQIELTCARRDSAAFQAVVSSEEDFLLTIREEPLFWKGGPLEIARLSVETDAPFRVNVHLIGLIEDDDRSLKSDILLQQSHIYVERRRIQPVWIELEAESEIPAGTYSGKLKLWTHTLFDDEKLEEELVFTVHVREEVLPEPKYYKFYLDLWQHNSNIARKYEVPLWSEEHFLFIDAYLKSLADLGQKALSVVVSEIPWSGQGSYLDREPSDLFEYSMVHVRRHPDGSYSYDFAALDRYVETGFKHGISSEIEVFGLLNIWQNSVYGSIVEGYPDGIRVRYYDEQSGSYRYIRERPHLEAYIRALESHLTEKGWIDKVRILADEPADYELFSERINTLQQIAPSFKYKAAINHANFIQKKVKGLHDYVPILTCAANEAEQIESLRGEIPGRLLFYVCCHPKYPNTFLGSPSIEARVIPWLAEKLKYDGFLRWNYTVWPDRPLENIVYRPSVWPAGDTNFVYPGPSGKPMLSLRYKWLQRGIRDFEYMQLLKETGRGHEVEKVLNHVFLFADIKDLYVGESGAELYSQDPGDYDRLYRIGSGSLTKKNG
ncbi:protein of unknown function [Lihuaxuella thermophila]|uniref:Glycoside hydrolase 123 catalytic domain-containing protein n=1 Tax=Lihuaxuella thermophila TaxID=1173111 RepID=A0A1H8FVU1_9BACL|nr:DUF4091 domain-containing protein [Lihuaxuella thermophila]SEN35836.1 protein of unknown function [Lihuaxuella thermophila]